MDKANDSFHKPAICIRAPNWVGDVVMATPFFLCVRQQLPDAHITLVIRKKVAAVLRNAPWFDKAVVFDETSNGRIGAFIDAVRRLRKTRIDSAFVLPNSFSSALMMRLAGARRIIGYRRDSRSFLLTDAISRPSAGGEFRPTYMVDYYLALAERADLRACAREIRLHYSDADRKKTDRMLHSQGIAPGGEFFLMHPGAGYGPAKRWDDVKFARLAEMLHAETGATPAVIGAPSERDHLNAIAISARIPIVDLTSCGIDLHLLKCVVARSMLLITTDSGPRHYGVALGIPTVCIMGPNHPGYSTCDRANDIVVRLDVDCGPCQRKRCPRDHRCMEDITPEMVFEACFKALALHGVSEATGLDRVGLS